MCTLATYRLTLYVLGNFACFFVICGFFFLIKMNFFKNILLEYHQSIKQFGIRSGPTHWSGSKLFAKVVSRWKKVATSGERVYYYTTTICIRFLRSKAKTMLNVEHIGVGMTSAKYYIGLTCTKCITYWYNLC